MNCLIFRPLWNAERTCVSLKQKTSTKMQKESLIPVKLKVDLEILLRKHEIAREKNLTEGLRVYG